MSTADDPYSFFGDVVCINLESRPDRRAYAQKVFDDLRIPARFLTVPKHPRGGIRDTPHNKKKQETFCHTLRTHQHPQVPQ